MSLQLAFNPYQQSFPQFRSSTWRCAKLLRSNDMAHSVCTQTTRYTPKMTFLMEHGPWDILPFEDLNFISKSSHLCIDIGLTYCSPLYGQYILCSPGFGYVLTWFWVNLCSSSCVVLASPMLSTTCCSPYFLTGCTMSTQLPPYSPIFCPLEAIPSLSSTRSSQ